MFSGYSSWFQNKKKDVNDRLLLLNKASTEEINGMELKLLIISKIIEERYDTKVYRIVSAKITDENYETLSNIVEFDCIDKFFHLPLYSLDNTWTDEYYNIEEFKRGLLNNVIPTIYTHNFLNKVDFIFASKKLSFNRSQISSVSDLL